MLTILPELKSFFRGKVHAWSDELLEESIKAMGGAATPVIVWNSPDGDILIDGHRRLEVCEKLGLPYKIERMDFANLDEVKEFMKSWQFCRRNATDHMFSLAVAKCYKKEKAERESKLPSKHHSAEPSAIKKTQAKFGVSKSTIKRDIKLAEAIESLPEEIGQKIVKGEIKCSRSDIEKLSKEPPLEASRILRDVEAGREESVSGAVAKKAPPIDKMLLMKKLKEKLGRFASDLNELRDIDRHRYWEIREHVHNIGLVIDRMEAELL